jgi:hypothetical protein
LKRIFRSKLVILVVFVLVAVGLINDVKMGGEKRRNEGKVLRLDDGVSETAREFIEQLGLENPGAFGEPVVLPGNLPREIKTKVDADFAKNKFNSFVSDMISLNRKLPDLRSEACRAKEYSKNLPKCSIVVAFHNENRSISSFKLN